MAVKIIPNKIVPTKSGAVLELIADAESDLTGLETIEGFDIDFGSLCLIVATGDIWAVDSSGTWTNQTGDA